LGAWRRICVLAIARVWRGVTSRSKRAEYLAYLKETGVNDIRKTPGNLGVTILVRDTKEGTEFLYISVWKSMSAIRRFAGDDVEKARYYPKDREFLLKLERKVKHYEVAFES
jgi:heme-degrading monooxygenase HmoA